MSKNFGRFKAEAERVQKLWGLNDWKVWVVDEKPRSEDAIASTSAGSTKRVARIKYSTKNGDALSAEEVKETARHEMCHVLIGEVGCMMGSRFVTSDEVEAAEEALVQRLLRLLPK